MSKTYARIDANYMEVTEQVPQKVKHSIQEIMARKERLQKQMDEVNELIVAWNAL